ncbi:MAG: adaptor protein MecA [Acutalibacteraceae bacterium]|nr:adaptor protein MecA [Acutalibacteraceae bacterium]
MHIKKIKVNTNSFLYEINGADMLLNTIENLYGYNNKRNTLYRYNNKYYLELCGCNLKTNIPNTQKHLKGILEEYGNLICNNAISKIGSKLKDF